MKPLSPGAMTNAAPRRVSMHRGRTPRPGARPCPGLVVAACAALLMSPTVVLADAVAMYTANADVDIVTNLGSSITPVKYQPVSISYSQTETILNRQYGTSMTPPVQVDPTYPGVIDFQTITGTADAPPPSSKSTFSGGETGIYSVTVTNISLTTQNVTVSLSAAWDMTNVTSGVPPGYASSSTTLYLALYGPGGANVEKTITSTGASNGAIEFSLPSIALTAGNSVVLTFDGTLSGVATAAVPEPSSLSLLMVAALIGVCVAARQSASRRHHPSHRA